MIREIESAIIRHLENNAMRCDLVVYVSDDLRRQLVEDYESAIGEKPAGQPEMVCGCEMRTIKDMHEPFSVVHRKHLASY